MGLWRFAFVAFDMVKSRDNQTIVFRTSFTNTIYDVMKHRGWVETNDDSMWDFHWADRNWMTEDVDTTTYLESWQKILHFRNSRELCRKDLLIRNLKKFKKLLEREKRIKEIEEMNFFPETYILPGEYPVFADFFKRNPNETWIMKPIGRSQGKGIFLFRNIKEIGKWRSENRHKSSDSEVEAYVVQRYINNPFLLGGKKFDMRLYALVTSYLPLTVYVYRGGFARCTNARYSSDPSDITKSDMHLTNVALQKRVSNYDKTTGSKWDIRSLKLYLLSRYSEDAVIELFAGIENIIVKSLLSVQSAMINDKHCFELYGYDILFDDQLKPWLIEVNASPSLSANTDDDYALKFSMLSDVLDIIDMEGRFTGEETTMGGFDLIYKGVPIPKSSSMFGTSIGFEIPHHDAFSMNSK